MVETVTIPLGGTDYGGNPLPPQGTFFTPGKDQTTVGDDTGGWAPYTPPQADIAKATTAPQGDDTGGWAQYTSPEPEKPKRQQSAGEAAGRGAIQAATFGTAPAITGLAAASGMEARKPGPDDNPDTFFDPNPIRPVVGAAKLIANYFSEHPDQTVKDAYERGRKDAEETQKQSSEQHPYAYTAGQLASTLATLPFTGGGGSAATVGGRLLQGIKSGGIGGGAFGAGESIGEGGDAWDVAKGGVGGALVGAGLGGMFGSAVEGATGVAKKVASVVRGARDTEAEAGSRVVSALVGDRPQVAKVARDTGALKAGTEAGTPLYNVDFGGENSRALLRSAANTSPTARNIINEKLGSRYKQQADRFSGYIRSKFGGHDKSADIEVIKDIARKENAPAYRRAYTQGDHEIYSPELERLSSAPHVQTAISDAIRTWKNYAVRDGYGAMNPAYRVENGGIIKTDSGLKAFPNLQLWDYAARELQDKAKKLAGTQEGALYNDLARMLKNELDQHVPSYKAAREGAATFFKASDAVEAGANFVKDGTISTAQGARAFASMSPAEQELFRRGFASELANQIERSGYRSDVLNSLFVSSPRATQRIKIALGEQGARDFESLVRMEGIVNQARQALGNSTTARQLNEMGLAGGAGVAGAYESLKGVLNPAYLLAGAFVLGGKHAARAVDEKVAVKVAEMLLSHDPAELARGYKIISQNPVMRDALRGAGEVGIRQLINYARPSGVAAGAATAYMKMRPGNAVQQIQEHADDQNLNAPEPVH
jgi:hypothetical protein